MRGIPLPNINSRGEVRPPVRLPNGKKNPAYHVWYYYTEPGLEYAKKRIAGERHKATNRRLAREAYQNPEKRRAMLAHQRDTNHKTLKNATLHGNLWDTVDECYLLEKADTMDKKEMAFALGRTLGSVKRKLSRLRKQEAEGGQPK